MDSTDDLDSMDAMDFVDGVSFKNNWSVAKIRESKEKSRGKMTYFIILFSLLILKRRPNHGYDC